MSIRDAEDDALDDRGYFKLSLIAFLISGIVVLGCSWLFSQGGEIKDLRKKQHKTEVSIDTKYKDVQLQLDQISKDIKSLGDKIDRMERVKHKKAKNFHVIEVP